MTRKLLGLLLVLAITQCKMAISQPATESNLEYLQILSPGIAKQLVKEARLDSFTTIGSFVQINFT